MFSLKRFFSPVGSPDIDKFMQRLARHDFTNYSDMDRYRDFRRLFLGTQQGEKVLSQIFDICGLLKPTVSETTDPYMAFHREGSRAVAISILAILNAEPKPYQEENDV